jgi:hypothetical protein
MKIIFFTAILSVFFCTYCKACDCDEERQSMQKLLKSSKVVFTGTVISTKRSDFRDTISQDTYQEFIIRVDSMIVGDFTTREITVITEHSSCGQFLRTGRKYLIYAYVDMQNNLRIHQCHSPCNEINTEVAKMDLEEIRKLKPN